MFSFSTLFWLVSSIYLPLYCIFRSVCKLWFSSPSVLKIKPVRVYEISNCSVTLTCQKVNCLRGSMKRSPCHGIGRIWCCRRRWGGVPGLCGSQRPGQESPAGQGQTQRRNEEKADASSPNSCLTEWWIIKVTCSSPAPSHLGLKHSKLDTCTVLQLAAKYKTSSSVIITAVKTTGSFL